MVQSHNDCEVAGLISKGHLPILVCCYDIISNIFIFLPFIHNLSSLSVFSFYSFLKTFITSFLVRNWRNIFFNNRKKYPAWLFSEKQAKTFIDSRVQRKKRGVSSTCRYTGGCEGELEALGEER